MMSPTLRNALFSEKGRKGAGVKNSFFAIFVVVVPRTKKNTSDKKCKALIRYCRTINTYPVTVR